MKLFIVIITITCFFLTGSSKSSVNYPTDILTNPKDDCGNVCGKINIDIAKSTCDDPDKRNITYLLVHDTLDKNEEQTEYVDDKRFECVNKCPDNFQTYNYSTNFFCVKDVDKFVRDTTKISKKIDENTNNAEVEIKAQQDDKFNYTWWIVGGVAILIVVVTSVVVGIFLRKRSDNVDLAPPSRPIRML